MTRIWRITKSKYDALALSGEGARRHGSRWTSRGLSALLFSGSMSLAALDALARLGSTGPLSAYSSIFAVLDEDSIQEIDADLLPDNWRASPAPSELGRYGDAWLAEADRLALRIPSAVIPFESNYILNPSHPGFSKLRFEGPDPFVFDSRLFGTGA